MTDPFYLIIILGTAALLPFIAVISTSFIKLSVVFSLVRNALGVQQIPPNMALNALAIILSGYIMAPVFMETYDLVSAAKPNISTVDGLKTAYDTGRGPIERFLNKHAAEREKAFFLQSALTLWPKNLAEGITKDSMVIVLPAFTVSQLREAFEIGFLLYLPFIAIDLIVTNILLALGMMMVSPLTISLPFKLFLFIMVDGWSRLILGLIKTYAH
jgi:type III secretion protein R